MFFWPRMRSLVALEHSSVYRMITAARRTYSLQYGCQFFSKTLNGYPLILIFLMSQLGRSVEHHERDCSVIEDRRSSKPKGVLISWSSQAIRIGARRRMNEFKSSSRADTHSFSHAIL